MAASLLERAQRAGRIDGGAPENQQQQQHYLPRASSWPSTTVPQMNPHLPTGARQVASWYSPSAAQAGSATPASSGVSGAAMSAGRATELANPYSNSPHIHDRSYQNDGRMLGANHSAFESLQRMPNWGHGRLAEHALASAEHERPLTTASVQSSQYQQQHQRHTVALEMLRLQQIDALIMATGGRPLTTDPVTLLLMRQLGIDPSDLTNYRKPH